MNKWVGFSIALVLGLVIGGSGAYILSRPSGSPIIATRSGGFSFINPLLACDATDDAPSAELAGIQSAVRAQINTLVGSGKAKRISVYVRNMDTGIWTGVNQDEQYVPASLLKVPIMIAFLKDAEDGQPSLSARLYLPASPDDNAAEHIKPIAPLALGRSYPISTLIQAMIEQSDNNAMDALENAVSTTSLNDVFSQFDVTVAPDETDNVVSPADYFRFFRLLYNGTYLSHEDSQRAIELLAQVKYDAGLDAGVPDGITVAHKFGEREILNADGSTQTVELHDCGIVYYPHIPYGICIMTEGSDISTLQSDIQALSRTVYNKVSQGGMPSAN